MLLTDSYILTQAELSAEDAEVVNVAQTFNVTLTGPGSIVDKTIGGACQEITASFQNFSGYLIGIGMSSAHVAAVLNTLSTSINRPRMQMNQVVAIQPNPSQSLVTRWLEYKALYHFYRAVFHRKLEDRYEKKMNLWDKEAGKAWNNLISSGIPVVIQPLACPGAVREFQAGTWGTANLSGTGSGSTETGNPAYDVAITWVAIPGYISQVNRGNSESAPSATATGFNVPAGQFLTVSIASLNPPTGTIPSAVGTASGIYTPLGATHWNIYAGKTGGTLYLQNPSPIPVATQSYALTGVVQQVNSNPVWVGQAPDYNYAFQNMLFRA